MNLNLADTFNIELPADPMQTNSRRQVHEAAFSTVTPRVPTQPKLIHAAEEVGELLGIPKSIREGIQSKDFLEVFSGAKVLEGSNPYAMVYGGHQFGNWAGQLGDGRAINLGEVVHNNQRWAMQLKGAGETPYSRMADGLAVLRSSIREHLCSEAMYHLGVPTTRSLSLILTGDEVLRDMMYDGNSAYEKGAVVCRVAPSFVRFGNFQIFAARQDKKNLQKLVDYTIKYFFTDIKSEGKEKYISFLESVAKRTLKMIIEWQRVGFVHGVMNTDNMSILGLTIDYGPYGWLEGYDHGWTPNTTDRGTKRYRFGNQPVIAAWNLLQLANVIYLLVEEAKPLETILESFQKEYKVDYLNMMNQKLGLSSNDGSNEKLITELERMLHLTETDMTIFFRNLANVKQEDSFVDFAKAIEKAFYKKEELVGTTLKEWQKWFAMYQVALKNDSSFGESRKASMNQVNPKYVLRNYMAQLAIDAADKGDYSVIEELYQLLKSPYDEQPEKEQWFAKRPEWARHKVGCSMLSCSS